MSVPEDVTAEQLIVAASFAVYQAHGRFEKYVSVTGFSTKDPPESPTKKLRADHSAAHG